MAEIIIAAEAEAPVVALDEGLSFWGGVDPASGWVIDAHHPNRGAALAGRIVMMPTSRGSCSGSGVLLELALNGHAPAALIFREAEDILTLGALVAARIYGRPLAVLRLDADSYAALGAGEREGGGKVLVAVSPRSGGDAALAALVLGSWHGSAVERAELLAVSPCWSGASRRLLGVLRALPASLRGVELPAPGTGPGAIQPEPLYAGYPADPRCAAELIPRADQRQLYLRALGALEGLAAKHGGAVRCAGDAGGIGQAARGSGRGGGGRCGADHFTGGVYPNFHVYLSGAAGILSGTAIGSPHRHSLYAGCAAGLLVYDVAGSVWAAGGVRGERTAGG